MAKLTPQKKKKIIADYIQCRNYSEVARKHNISRTIVRKTVISDSESYEKFQKKEDEIIQDTLSYMQGQHDTKKRILEKLLIAIENKAENIDMFTNIKDLATSYGIILDKELKIAELKSQENNKEPTGILPDILEALKNAKNNVE